MPDPHTHTHQHTHALSLKTYRNVGSAITVRVFIWKKKTDRKETPYEDRVEYSSNFVCKVAVCMVCVAMIITPSETPTCEAHVLLTVGRLFRVVELEHIQDGLRVLLLL